MPFDYMHSKVPRSYTDVGEKAEAQYLKELRERASLLHRIRSGNYPRGIDDKEQLTAWWKAYYESQRSRL